MFTKQKGFAPIIILVLVVLIIIGYFGYKNWAKTKVIISPTPTASISLTKASYSSNQFSFSLPLGWISTNPNPSNSTFDSKGQNLSDSVRLTVVDTSQSYNGLECVEPTKKVTRKIGNKSLTITYYSGIEGGMCDNPTLRVITFVPAGDFLISYLYDQADTKNAEAALEQILSTFKFSDLVCGGIANIKCPPGYACSVTATYPDASGTCIKN